jgi:hypothetical protein
MCRDRRQRPPLGRPLKAKAWNLRRRHQNTVEGEGSYNTGGGLRTTEAKAPAKASLVEAPRTQESSPLGGSTGSWADDGLSTVVQQAKTLEEEDNQTAPGNLY